MRYSTFPLGKLAAISALAVAVSACSLSIGDDKSETPVAGKTVTGKSFDKVLQSGPDTVIIEVGDTPAWTVEADAETLEKMAISVDGDELKIGRKGSLFSWSDGSGAATIRVTMPLLKEFSMAGSGDATIAEMTADTARISIAGSGDVSVAKLDVSQLEIDIGGSGSASLAGAAKIMAINLAGSGDIQAAKLKVDDAKVAIAGSGSVDFASDGAVDAAIMGSGSVNVSGKAKCSEASMGSGELTCG